MSSPEHTVSVDPIVSVPPLRAGSGLFDSAPKQSAPLDPGLPPDPELLLKNIKAIARRQPALAKRLAQLDAPSPARFFKTDEEGAISAELDGKALTSRRRPLTEATRLADRIDIESHGGLLVIGIGLGHHVSAIAKRTGDACALVLFEPDLALLRAVLERIDHSAWLALPQSAIVTDAEDVGALTADLKGLDALLSVGIDVIEHAPNTARLGKSGARVLETLTKAVSAMRMHVITAMVQADVTARNELMNLGHYVSRPGIVDLKGIAKGRPAILVAAGPSLRSSIEQLKDPALRERCVIIAVQTVLKPLLEAGIKPHFVTAIDYHEISRRFYEGLTPEDVEGVTLVAEARTNAAVLDAFPGEIRVPRDDFLDLMLHSDSEHPDRGKLTAAATVAHLSHYLARYMGCDPAILVGQDLAFTDAQYYGAGAAIHNVWAPELNPMRTLEMLEWERIVRSKGHLHRVTDVLGRPVFTDHQMATYLAQFERDFADCQERGQTVIDASEGVRKRHTTPMQLTDAIARHAGADAPPLPPIPAAKCTDDAKTRQATAKLLRKIRSQTRVIERNAERCGLVLSELQEHQHDKAKNKELVRKAHALRTEAEAQQPAFTLITKINQLGGFKRFKADRAIALAKHQDELKEQSARIDRDLVNLKWIEEYAQVFEDLLSVSERALQGGEKRTRDITPDQGMDDSVTIREAVRTGAVIHTDMGTGNAEHLRATIDRLLRSKHLDAVVVQTSAPERYTDLSPGVVVERCEPLDPAMLRSLRAGRVWARDGWRGGLANLSVFDEALDPASASAMCEKHAINAVYTVGSDWVAVDPELTDRVIERHLESPGVHPVVFTQAPPGVCGALIRADAIKEMAQGRAMAKGSMFATVGGVLGYTPLSPRHDPIARPSCVQIDEDLRDRAVRTIADQPATPDGELLAHELIIDEVKPLDTLHSAISCFAESSPQGIVTIACDALDMQSIADHARDAGLLIHVRTPLRDADLTERLITMGLDVISIDTYSADRATYEALAGIDACDAVRRNLDQLLEARTLAGGLPTTWVVPRLTKRDAVYSEIESFYDTWLHRTGAAVIDPLPAPIKGERITPLPLPNRAQDRLSRRTLRVGGY